MEKVFLKAYDDFVARASVYLKPKPVLLVRWAVPIAVYGWMWFKMLFNLDVLRLLMQMSSAFFIFLQHILGCQYVFLTEGRSTKIQLGDKDDRGLHYSFPEVKFWLGFVASLLFYWIPMALHKYHLVVCIGAWIFLFVARTLIPFKRIQQTCQKSFAETLTQCLRIATSVLDLK